MEFAMTKCLSCGHFRHDFELNCPKCGSFYSTIADGFSTNDFKREKSVKALLTQLKSHFEKPKHRLVAIGIVIFLVIVVLFL
jgi:uncharacterized membrane protein YvbJ